MIKKVIVKAFLMSVIVLTGYVSAEDLLAVRNKDIEKSGLALGVQNLWLGQDVKGQSDIFTNDTKEIVYYASFKNLTNVNLFQAKIYTIEWLDPNGAIYFSDTVATAYGNNNLVSSRLKIQGSLACEKLGTWTCKFYKKGILFDEKHFLLEVPGAEEKRLAEAARLREETQLIRMKEAVAAEAKRTAESNAINVQRATPLVDVSANSQNIQSATEVRPVDVTISKDTFDANAQSAIRNLGRILIIEPQLVYENAYTEQRFGATDNSTLLIVSTDLPAKAVDVMSKSGRTAITINALSDSQKDAIKIAFNNLHDNTEELIKQWKDKSKFLQDFALIKDTCKCDAILVQFVKAKMGVGGTWDFINSGAITAPTSTTIIKAVLIDLNSGNIIWSDSAMERNIPEKYVIKNCLDKLYTNFPGYKK